MIKNFMPKKGDQISFIITFTTDVNFDSVEMGVKKEYTDEDFVLLKTLNHGITQLDSRRFQVIITSEETDKLEFGSYIYDIRTRSGDVIKTPLSGKIIVKESVFNG